MSSITQRPIYLDYHSTTPIDPRVVSKVTSVMNNIFGNPSSLEHFYGTEAQSLITEAKRQVCNLIKCTSSEVIFTSGATESINLAIQGIVHQARNRRSEKKMEIVVSPIEHRSVLETCFNLEKHGIAKITKLNIKPDGNIDYSHLRTVCSAQPILLCVMAANHEIGTINNINNIGEIAKQFNVPFLCDATQAVGKVDIDFNKSNATFLALSSHKFYGPKGIGALVIRKGTAINPLFYGGGQQMGLRPGTLNVPGIAGFGEACRLRALEMNYDEKLIKNKRDKLQNLLIQLVPEIIINGDLSNRLSGNLNISIPGLKNTDLIFLIRSKIAISTSSACSSGKESSHVLKALGLSEDIIKSSLRIGIGKFTTEKDIDRSAKILADSINILKR
ncbi:MULTISPECIES: cysteine desulfurase family protein [Cytobacillus]|uniref:Aminotransferase n=1 Tax=Cytobacillus oceanisediminis TaxID=665099 RepID=A0ABX3CKS4_9BACI|nr:MULTISPECIES: cysteine desulfurase family protein [Cytobacillus]OHX40721.1 aminotransferase [Cytobacillus oceanisediminis]